MIDCYLVKQNLRSKKNCLSFKDKLYLNLYKNHFLLFKDFSLYCKFNFSFCKNVLPEKTLKSTEKICLNGINLYFLVKQPLIKKHS